MKTFRIIIFCSILVFFGCNNNQTSNDDSAEIDPSQPKVLLTEVSGADTLVRLGYYYETGELKVTQDYINQVKRGYEKYYYRNGIIKYEIYFVGEKPMAVGVGHSQDGKKMDIGNLIYGTGSLKIYYDDGTPEYSVYFKNYLKDSTWTYYYPNGNFRSITNYKEGFEHGESKVFYENGNLAGEGLLENGRTVIEKNYFPDGSKNKVLKYKDGLLHGECVEYYKGQNQIRQLREFKEGKLHGIIKSFYESGELEWEGTMKKNQPIGIWKHFDKEGNLVETRNTELGESVDLEVEI